MIQPEPGWHRPTQPCCRTAADERIGVDCPLRARDRERDVGGAGGGRRGAAEGAVEGPPRG
eukprot:7283249-Alexandrium_andersonii.AAC.1